MSDRALCPCCAATWTWLDGPACPHCGWNARDATAGMGAARAVVEESLRKAGWTTTVHSSGAGGTGGGGGGGSSTANIPVYVEGHAYPVAYARARYVSPAWSPPEVPRDPSWQESRKTWLETGDLSALTAMDACDPSGMSGDDWLDCDEYDAKRTPAPELPPTSAGHWDWSAVQTAGPAGLWCDAGRTDRYDLGPLAVSDKMECPGCGSYTSSVLAKVEQGEPCPYCGLSAAAVHEIRGVRRKKADEDLKGRLEKALIERDRAVTEAAGLRRRLYDVRRAVGCGNPYAPHEGMDPEP